MQPAKHTMGFTDAQYELVLLIYCAKEALLRPFFLGGERSGGQTRHVTLMTLEYEPTRAYCWQPTLEADEVQECFFVLLLVQWDRRGGRWGAFQQLEALPSAHGSFSIVHTGIDR